VYREEYYLSRAEPERGTDAHVQWQVKKDAVANRAELIIGKNRHGPIETVHLNFHGQYTRFSSLAR
jgi:replicative DNA helicase